MTNVVRGYGPLDRWLAEQRHKIARKKLRPAQNNSRLLDIGCGNYPLFLTSLDFSEKYGLDKLNPADVSDEIKNEGITLVNCDIEKTGKLPFDDDYFDAVTMLAVFEHIEPNELVTIHREIHRILKPGGIYVMTTPAFWTEWLLKTLAKIRLISDVEIKEHKDSYSHTKILSVLQKAGFKSDKLRFGYFELFMNNWATAVK